MCVLKSNIYIQAYKLHYFVMCVCWCFSSRKALQMAFDKLKNENEVVSLVDFLQFMLRLKPQQRNAITVYVPYSLSSS